MKTSFMNITNGMMFRNNFIVFKNISTFYTISNKQWNLFQGRKISICKKIFWKAKVVLNYISKIATINSLVKFGKIKINLLLWIDK